MPEGKINLATYQQVLKELEGKECHLLLGNGFNRALKVKTDYESIFKNMMKENAEYLEVKPFLDGEKYDLEKLIGELKSKIPDGEKFLPKFIHNKVKLDFMKAASKIAASQVNKIFKEKNESINLLLKNFTNYFTLNYDPFLYLLLMKFKKSDNKKKEALALPQTHLFQAQEVDDSEKGLYSKIEEVRLSGKIEIHSKAIDDSKDLGACAKTEFKAIVKPYFKKQRYEPLKIDQAIDLLWENKKENNTLEIDDAFRQGSLFGELEGEPVYSSNILTQNLFFLHGAFHIYEDNKITKKITQTSDKALYERLEEIISSEEKEIICIFSNTDKADEIMTNEYLKSAYEKLSNLSQNLVIIGSSLAENDNHIFNQINNSDIQNIYISTTEKSKMANLQRSKEVFPKKDVLFFDANTISYEKTLAE